jgi:dihydrofolate reductase
MKPISNIVAVAGNNGIGKDNKLLCHIPGDLKRFRRITGGHTVIMGKNTFLSLPGGALPNRRNIVITDNRSERFPGCEMVYSVEEAIEHGDDDKENFVIGGASVYRQFLPLADTLYLTRVDKVFEADTFFPEISGDEWEEISREVPESDSMNDFTYAYLILKRKKLSLNNV